MLALAAASLNAQEARPVLTAQTANGQAIFHIGERIPLKLTFSSPNDTEFLIAPRSNGRGADLDRESFEVNPPVGWSDPLATYFERDFPLIGHLWLPAPLLKSKPVETSLDLNQWARFDQPGVYRVTVTSRRVYSADRHDGPITLQSNVIELQIIAATQAWQDAKLKATLPKLDPANPSFQGAVGNLRYLATQEAIDEMTRRMRQGDAYTITSECSMGLAGLPVSMRDFAIASMEKRINERNYPISSTFVRTMALLHVSPGSNADSVREQRRAFDATLRQMIFSAVAKKEGVARAQTVQTLLNYWRNTNTDNMNAQIAPSLSASLLDLDERSQMDDLRQRWDMLRSPGILPALETLAKLPSLSDSNLGPYSRENLKSVAFRRWYELDPAGARSEILAEIGTATPALSAQAIRFMPTELLPEFESIWAQSFVQSTSQQQESVVGSLLVRFGTGTAVTQMNERLSEASRDYPCMSRALALAYLVRFSPENARPLLKREMANGEVGCDGTLLLWISEHATASMMNEIADEALNDTNPKTFGDAIRYLTSYGRKADEQIVWDRFAKWATAWAGEAAVLDHQEPGLHDMNPDLREGESLGLALIANQGWFADQALVARVLEMCVGQQMCKTLRDALAAGAPLNRVVVPDASEPLGTWSGQSFAVAQYNPKSREQLEAKLSQYPTGTKFTLFRVWTGTEDQQKLEDEVRAIFKKHGMILETQTN